MNKKIKMVFLFGLYMLQNVKLANNWSEGLPGAIFVTGVLSLFLYCGYKLDQKYFPRLFTEEEYKQQKLEAQKQKAFELLEVENKALKERLEKLENKNGELVEEVSLKEKLKPQLTEDEQGHFLIQNNFTEIKKTSDKILLPGQSVANNLGKSNLIKKACDLKEQGVGLIRNKIKKIEFGKGYDPLYFINI